MKIFAIYSNIELTQKPEWLDDFRVRYNAAHDYHVTLKQPTYIEEYDVQKIQENLSQLVHNAVIPEGGIRLTFDSVVTDIDPEGKSTIMINAQKNELIETLQKQIVAAFKNYDHLYNPASRNWEENFQPHITIGDGLDNGQLKVALAELENVLCVGIIQNIVLSVVKDMSLDEINDPVNKTVYEI